MYMILNKSPKVANAQAEMFPMFWRALRCMKRAGHADEYAEMSTVKQENEVILGHSLPCKMDMMLWKL